MIAVCADLKEHDLVAGRDLQAGFPQDFVHFGAEDRPPVLGRAHGVIQQGGDVMAVANEGAHALR